MGWHFEMNRDALKLQHTGSIFWENERRENIFSHREAKKGR